MGDGEERSGGVGGENGGGVGGVYGGPREEETLSWWLSVGGCRKQGRRSKMKERERVWGYLYSGEVMIASFALESQIKNVAFQGRGWAAFKQKVGCV